MGNAGSRAKDGTVSECCPGSISGVELPGPHHLRGKGGTGGEGGREGVEDKHWC